MTLMFPTLAGQAFPISRTVEWRTREQEAASGKSTTLPDWLFPHYTWKISHNFLRQGTVNGVNQTEMQQLFAFFNSCKGGFSTFLYQDQDDNTCSNQTIAVGDGISTVFFLARSSGGAEDITLAPDLSAPFTLTINNTIISILSYSVTPWGTSNAAGPGRVVFNSAPPAGAIIGASFSYFWPCRFMADACLYDKFLSGYYKTAELAFRSIYY